MQTTGPKISGVAAGEKSPSLPAEDGGAVATKSLEEMGLREGQPVADASGKLWTAYERVDSHPAVLTETEQRLIDLDARLTSQQRRIESLESENISLRALLDLPARLSTELRRVDEQLASLRGRL